MFQVAGSDFKETRFSELAPCWVCFSALALAILDSLLTVVLIGALTTSTFGASELLEWTLWSTSPVIGVFLTILRYRTYFRWRETTHLLGLAVCISYLGLGSVVFTIRFLSPQSLSVTLLICALVVVVTTLQVLRLVVNQDRDAQGDLNLSRSVARPILQFSSVTLGTLLIFATFWPRVFTLNSMSVALVFACCGTPIIEKVTRLNPPRAYRYVAGIVIVAVVALAVWDFSRDFDIHHLGFFLAPINEVQHGRLMLTDTFSQYGVGVFYFLAAVFKILGLGYGSMSLLTGCLTSLMAVLIFAVLMHSTKSTLYSTIGTCTYAILGPLASEGSVASYPSTGFLRFGPTWLLILVLTITLKQEIPSRVWVAITSIVLAISTVWSFESAFYSLGTYSIVGVIGPIVIGERRIAAQFVRSAMLSVTIFSLTGLLLTVFFSDQSIDFGRYLSYIKLYSLDGLGALPVEPWSPGILMFLFAIGSLATLVLSMNTAASSSVKIRRDLFPILAVTAYAILSFTYFLNRSHPNNLSHISAPVVVMVTMWVAYLCSNKPFGNKLFRIAFITCILFGVAIIGLGNSQSIDEKYQNSALASLTPSTTLNFLDQARWFLSNPIVDSRYETIQSLLNKHLSRNTPVLMVVDANLLTEALVRLRKVNLIAFSNPEGQSLLSSEIHRITDSLNSVSCDSHILLQVSDFRKNDAQQTLLTMESIIRSRFDLVLVAEDDEFALFTTSCS